jgi:hypothetical protein
MPPSATIGRPESSLSRKRFATRATLVPSRLKSPEDGADSEFDSRLGTDGNQNQTASVEKGRRTTPPFSFA